MPLIFHKNLYPEGELGLWKIDEPEGFFLEQMDLLPREAKRLKQIKGHRRSEWLAARWLLHQMSGRTERGACLKDEFGKPYLEHSMFNISISHSRAIAAVAAAPCLVGIDIQKIVDKIESIAHKYMRAEEMESLRKDTRIEHLHVYWGAKEALFKAYGRRKLDFKAHIFIEPFTFDVALGHCRGYVIKDDYEKAFDIRYELFEDYVLVLGMEELDLIA